MKTAWSLLRWVVFFGVLLALNLPVISTLVTALKSGAELGGNPSFWIDTTRQLCGCHAGCTPKPLDVIDLFARICSLGNDEAIRVLSRGLDGGG